MSRPHRHHHAITAGRSAREWQQNVNAQAAEKIRAAAELLTDAAALLRHSGLALRAFELAQMAKDLQPATGTSNIEHRTLNPERGTDPTPSPSKEGNLPSSPAAPLAADLAEADTAEPVAVKFPARPASGARAVLNQGTSNAEHSTSNIERSQTPDAKP